MSVDCLPGSRVCVPGIGEVCVLVGECTAPGGQVTELVELVCVCPEVAAPGAWGPGQRLGNPGNLECCSHPPPRVTLGGPFVLGWEGGSRVERGRRLERTVKSLICQKTFKLARGVVGRISQEKDSAQPLLGLQ